MRWHVAAHEAFYTLLAWYLYAASAVFVLLTVWLLYKSRDGD